GSEAELWFSKLVQLRASTGLVLSPHVLPALRQRLTRSPATLEAAWRITAAVHAVASPALRVEEELTYLGLGGRGQAPNRAQDLLRGVVRALVERPTTGLAEWATRALPRLPRDVLKLEETQMVALAAAGRLGRTSTITAVGPQGLAGLRNWAWL